MVERSPEYVSDLAVDVLRELGIRAVALNPGASFRGLHDSLVNYDGPDLDLILCLHEEIAVAMAHGYAKATGVPMAVALHDVVGLQHASMAVFNAWCDRVPILLLGGTGPVSAVERRPWIDWIHTALVQGQQIRDYVKWDDQPADAASVPESILRAVHTAVASPPGPVYVCLDAGLQEDALSEPMPLDSLTGYQPPSGPAPSGEVVDELAQRLADARLPVIVTDYAGATDGGYRRLVELAESLQAPVIDGGRRFCFPTKHPLNFSQMPDVLSEADVVLGIDVEDIYGMLDGHVYETRGHRVTARDGVYVGHATPAQYKLRAWAHDYQRQAPLDLHVAAEATATLDALVAATGRFAPSAETLEGRRRVVGDRVSRARERWWHEAAGAEDDGAIPPARVAAELWPLIRPYDWTLVHGSLGGWELRLWDFEGPRRHLGWHGGGGLGYGAGASLGAAKALAPERLCINLQPDGDLLFTPSALWTAAHESIPLLTIVLNNRQYGNTVQHAARIAEFRGRPVENRHVGSQISAPNIDFSSLARSFGVWGSGPVTNPSDLPHAIREGLDVIQAGRPAVIEVVTTGA